MTILMNDAGKHLKQLHSSEFKIVLWKDQILFWIKHFRWCMAEFIENSRTREFWWASTSIFSRSTMGNDFLFLYLVSNMKGNFSRSCLEAWVPEILVLYRCGRLNRRKSHSRLGIEKKLLVELWCMGMSVLQWRPGCVTTKLLNLHFLKLEIANNGLAATFFVYQKRRSMQ